MADLAEKMADVLGKGITTMDVPGWKVNTAGPVVIVLSDEVCYVVEVHTIKRGSV